jgi:hypothetical protein
MEPRIFRQIDLAHTAGSQRLNDLIGPKSCACWQRHFHTSAVQFSTTLIDGAGAFSVATVVRKRWPALTNRAYGKCDDEIRFPDHTAFPRGCATVLLKGRVFNPGGSSDPIHVRCTEPSSRGECARTRKHGFNGACQPLHSRNRRAQATGC